MKDKPTVTIECVKLYRDGQLLALLFSTYLLKDSIAGYEVPARIREITSGPKYYDCPINCVCIGLVSPSGNHQKGSTDFKGNWPGFSCFICPSQKKREEFPVIDSFVKRELNSTKVGAFLSGCKVVKLRFSVKMVLKRDNKTAPKNSRVSDLEVDGPIRKSVAKKFGNYEIVDGKNIIPLNKISEETAVKQAGEYMEKIGRLVTLQAALKNFKTVEIYFLYRYFLRQEQLGGKKRNMLGRCALYLVQVGKSGFRFLKRIEKKKALSSAGSIQAHTDEPVKLFKVHKHGLMPILFKRGKKSAGLDKRVGFGVDEKTEPPEEDEFIEENEAPTEKEMAAQADEYARNNDPDLKSSGEDKASGITKSVKTKQAEGPIFKIRVGQIEHKLSAKSIDEAKTSTKRIRANVLPSTKVVLLVEHNGVPREIPYLPPKGEVSEAAQI